MSRAFFVIQRVDRLGPSAFFVGVPMPDDNPRFQISDIIIDSVGLVSRAAVSMDEDEPGTNFLLLKAQEDSMPDEKIQIEEVIDEESPPTPVEPELLPEEPPEGWKETIKGWFEDMFKANGEVEDVSKADPKALAGAVRMLREGGYEVSVQQLGQMLSGDEDEMEAGMGGKKKMKKSDEDEGDKPQEEPMAKQQNELAINEIVKAEIGLLQEQYQGTLDEIKKANENLVKANQELQTQVEEMRTDRDGERSARRRREFIEKGMNLRMLPLAATELGEVMLKAADAMADEDYQKLEALLKATDNQLAKAGILYGEIGTARTPEQATIEDKIAKADDPEAALLGLSADEQLELLKQWDDQASQGGGS
jgi:hypothetical protein